MIVFLENMDYQAAKSYIIQRLETELSSDLYYHGLHHTLDVLDAVERLANAEAISSSDTMLLRTAALFHDAGFIQNVHAGHEAVGCTIVREYLPSCHYTPAEIEKICGMIMATKIPQSPSNLLEQILCDADLDYLGRTDFYPISQSLFKELQQFGQLQDEKVWNRLQVSFIGAHSYFTKTNKIEREPLKTDYLDALIQKVEKY